MSEFQFPKYAQVISYRPARIKKYQKIDNFFFQNGAKIAIYGGFTYC